MIKKLLAYILAISLVLVPFPATAFLNPDPQPVVYRGTVTGLRISAVDGGATESGGAFVDNFIQTYAGFTCNLSTVNGTAFITNPSVSLDSFPVGTKFTLTAGGKTLVGYKKAAGSGEGLDSEFCGDPTFDSDAYWRKTTAEFTVSGGKARAASVSGQGNAVDKGIAGTQDKLFKGVLVCDSFTQGEYAFKLFDAGAIGIASTGTKTRYVTSTDNYFGVSNLSLTVELTATWTDISVKQVLAPSTSGATIVSAKSGATYNFGHKDAAFAYNEASYTVIVRKLR